MQGETGRGFGKFIFYISVNSGFLIYFADRFDYMCNYVIT